MASLLRQIVAGPRARHPEAGLDLCYVTDSVVVTSGPSSVWPKKAYRNPVDQLVRFLDGKHGEDWAIFEFRAEGTGYPDSEVYNRIHHFPWPDHHPPPFAMIPNIMASMRNWVQNSGAKEQSETTEDKKKRVAVVHCKAGKGRSGTVACSYLISEELWKKEDALYRFTSRRMRSGFGQGVSIPSQLRYVNYVDRWVNEMDKYYVERPVEIVEVHIWGLRDGVKVAVEGYLEEGKRIHTFHTFNRDEKKVIDQGRVPTQHAPMKNSEIKKDHEYITSPVDETPHSSISSLTLTYSGSYQTVILTPSSTLVLPSSDINIDFERRNKATYAGFTMVTSVAHVWFNPWFEGGAAGHDSGVFEILWDSMDGIKGSARKGTRAFEKLKVVWKYAEADASKIISIKEPKKGEPVPESEPADWKGETHQTEAEAKHSDGVDSGRPGATALTMGAMVNQGASTLGKELGLRPSQPESENISRASSIKAHSPPRKSVEVQRGEHEQELEGVKSHGIEEKHGVPARVEEEREGRQDTKAGQYLEVGLAKTASIVAKMRGGSKSREQSKSPAQRGHSVRASDDMESTQHGSQAADNTITSADSKTGEVNNINDDSSNRAEDGDQT